MPAESDRNKADFLRFPAGNPKGFSLTELVVVLFILSIVALAAIPGLSRSGVFHTGGGKGEELAALIRILKLRAVKENRPFTLHLHPEENRAWVTWAGPGTEPDSGGRPEKPIENLPLKKVEILGRPGADRGKGSLNFYTMGYSDEAVIVLETGEAEVSVKIHAFLPEAEILKGEVSLYDCG